RSGYAGHVEVDVLVFRCQHDRPLRGWRWLVSPPMGHLIEARQIRVRIPADPGVDLAVGRPAIEIAGRAASSCDIARPRIDIVVFADIDRLMNEFTSDTELRPQGHVQLERILGRAANRREMRTNGILHGVRAIGKVRVEQSKAPLRGYASEI